MLSIKVHTEIKKTIKDFKGEIERTGKASSSDKFVRLN